MRICDSCRHPREIAYVEEGTQRQFCVECALALPPTSEELALLYIQMTTPFVVGDLVEARTAAQVFDGVGEVTEISTSLDHGGTMVFPTFHVVLESKAHDLAPDEAWYTEVCLTRVERESELVK
jgi:hypothetical protein